MSHQAVYFLMLDRPVSGSESSTWMPHSVFADPSGFVRPYTGTAAHCNMAHGTSTNARDQKQAPVSRTITGHSSGRATASMRLTANGCRHDQHGTCMQKCC